MKATCKLFLNDRKQGNQPDYRTSLSTPLVVTDPGAYRVAAWKQMTTDGVIYLSLSLEKVEGGVRPGPTREENIKLIQDTRQALAEGMPLPKPRGFVEPPPDELPF